MSWRFKAAMTSAAATPLEHARLLADDLERARTPRADRISATRFGRVVAGRQQVVLRVEPEDDEHVAGCREGGPGLPRRGRHRGQGEQQK